MTGIRDVTVALAALAVCAVPAVAHAAPPAPALILSIEDVRAISGNADLAPGPAADQPVGQHQFDAQYPAECHAVFDQDVAFAPGFTEFRTVTYTGPASRSVTQAVAVYPDAGSAKAALTSVGKQLNACSQLQSDTPAATSAGTSVAPLAVTTQVLDINTFALCQAQCSTLYRAEGPVLIAVDASKFGDSDRVATAVLAKITGLV